MITSLRLVDFKNFADETLRMRPFHGDLGCRRTARKRRFGRKSTA